MLRDRCASAQALVESALVLPVVLLLSLGLVQVVLYVHAHDVLVAAVQDGARLAAEQGRAPEEGTTRTRDLVVAGLGHSVEPLVVRASIDNQLVTIDASGALRPILPLVSDLSLRAVGRASRERFRPGGSE